MARTRFAVVAVPLALLAGTALPQPVPDPVRTELKAVKIDPPRSARFDAAALDAYVQTRNGIRECYREELVRDRGAKGRLLVRFTVGKGGDVTNVQVLKSELSPKLADCVINLMGDWITPFRPDAAVTIECPLLFAPAS